MDGINGMDGMDSIDGMNGMDSTCGIDGMSTILGIWGLQEICVVNHLFPKNPIHPIDSIKFHPSQTIPVQKPD
jgi:hypothetical protein